MYDRVWCLGLDRGQLHRTVNSSPVGRYTSREPLGGAEVRLEDVGVLIVEVLNLDGQWAAFGSSDFSFVAEDFWSSSCQ